MKIDLNKYKLGRKATITLIITVCVFILVLGFAYSGIADTFLYNEPFYIGVHQYPGSWVSYQMFKPDMEISTSEYEGLEFIGWYYIENGVEKEFIPSKFVPDREGDNYLEVYGRWKQVQEKVTENK